MIGTTGQGAADGMRFVQFYFGLPLAMVILGVTIVPFLTAPRCSPRTNFSSGASTRRRARSPPLLFLLSRGMSCGVDPRGACSRLFAHLRLATRTWCVLLMGVPTVLYTMFGGVQAVAWADVKQMALIVVAITAMVVVLARTHSRLARATRLHLAGATGRLRVFDFSFNLKNTYTFWSGIIGGTFLMLSYFGTDQSQVQRYLTASRSDEARSSLLISAYWKIPLQAMILLIGVLVFVFYLFEAPPLLYNPVQERKVHEAQPAALANLQTRYGTAVAARLAAAHAVSSARAAGDAEAKSATADFRARDSVVTSVRAEALSLVERTTGQQSKDVNYIIPRFVVEQLPIGLAGLFIAGVMAAAMSAIAAELNSLATSTVIDFYRRWFRKEASDAHFLAVSKGATAFWGLFACVVASYAATLGSLIEVVNRFGSFFYGSILGVFLLAMIPSARATGAFIGLIAGMSAVAAVNFGAPQVAFLWHNVVGAVTVVVVGMLVGGGAKQSDSLTV